jgi:glycosyltransferase involved in cell wall biosynthesis
MEKRKLNIGILSDSPFLTTGYATIASNMGNIFAEKGHNVFYFAHVYTGQSLVPGTTFEDGRKLNFNIIGQGREAYFKDLLSLYTKMYKLDVLVVLLDTFMGYNWFLSLDLSPAKTIWYFPSDGGSGMPLGCEQILKFVNNPVAMAKFGKQQVEKLYGVPCDYIPHAVDTTNYFPMKEDERKKLRQMWGLEGKFVVGSVFRNQGRKMADRTIKAFALFAKNNPDAILLLHTDPEDPAQVFPLQSLINRFGINNRVIFTGMKYYKGWDYREMYKVYNLMDVFLLTTSGEGFGIPIIESMACGIPVLATDYTTTRELAINNSAGIGINLVGTEESENPDVHCNEIIDGTITGSWAVERGICSVKNAAEKLQFLKDNLQLRRQMGEKGREAVLRDYNWEIVGNKWINMVEQLGGSY